MGPSLAARGGPAGQRRPWCPWGAGGGRPPPGPQRPSPHPPTPTPSRLLSYASTCQTLGTNAGFFASFSLLLALTDARFCTTRLGTPGAVWGLEGYLRFWG